MSAQDGLDISWTDSRIVQLKALWSRGLSASQIAAELGGISRSGVIGKVHRLGLSGRRVEVRAPAYVPVRPPVLGAPARRPPRTVARPVAISAQPVVRTDNGQGVIKRIRNNAAADAGELVTDEPQAIELPIDQSQFAVSLFDATESQCRHPLGNPSDLATFRFCGAPKVPDCPYCARHRALNWTGQMPARRLRSAGPVSARRFDHINSTN